MNPIVGHSETKYAEGRVKMKMTARKIILISSWIFLLHFHFAKSARPERKPSTKRTTPGASLQGRRRGFWGLWGWCVSQRNTTTSLWEKGTGWGLGGRKSRIRVKQLAKCTMGKNIYTPAAVCYFILFELSSNSTNALKKNYT